MPVSEAIALLETLHYRPRALAVDPQRLQAVRRRLRSNFWRRPFQDRFGPGSAGSDRRQP
jgi:hypothetical protein